MRLFRLAGGNDQEHINVSWKQYFNLSDSSDRKVKSKNMQISSAYKQRLAKAARIVSASALVASSIGTAVAPQSFAAALTANKTLIADSRTSGGGGSNVTYTIDFTPSVSTTAIKKVHVEFCTTADTFAASCTAPTGMSVPASLAGATASGYSGAGGATTGTFTQIGANSFDFIVTTPASESAIVHEMVLTNLIGNSSTAGTYYTRLQTESAVPAAIDEGVSAFAIVQKVNVTGRVLESLTFTVAQINSGVGCGTGDTATVTTTTTSVPFGNFLSGTPRIGCQTVTTATNAVSGYSTTVREVQGGSAPQGGMCRQTSTGCTTNGADVTTAAGDVIGDTVLNGTPASWTNGTTFGLGVGANGTEKDAAFSSATFYRSTFGATPIVLAGTTGPTTGNATYVTYKADVNSAQVAGVYQNSLEYVSTPTF
jgi:hypothetical protein